MLARLLDRTAKVATLDDVEVCYRLLLDRPPDEDGMAMYERRLATERLTILDVVTELVGSPEYLTARSRQPAEPDTVAIDSERFRVHVFVADRAIGQAMAVTGSYEPQVSDTVERLLWPGSVFVDVGANYGWHSLLAATVVGKAGRVVAIEPNPLNTKLLRRSAEDSGLSNITIRTEATSDKEGFGALETDGSNGRIISLDAGMGEPVACSFVVPLRPLDSILANAGDPAVDVMKVDVEGFELATLKGAAGTIERHRPVIVSEFFPAALRSTGGVAPENYLRALRDFGYSLSVIGREGDATDEQIVAGLDSNDHVDIVATPS